jgi:hypothetical protein
MTALSLPSNPVNGQKHIHADKVYIYNSSKGYWKVAGSEAVSDAAASLFTSQDTVHSANIATLYTLVEDSQGVTSYANTSLLPLSGVSAGSMAFVSGSNRLYISNGTGWYSISLVNTNPNITSVQDASSGNSPFTLATDGTATVITITANDPEQVPLTYNYSVTSGSLTNGGGTTATVTQSDNVFTVTPSTTEAYAGTFELTFTASDGINTATNANSFTLSFITYVTNSNYTTLLSTPTAPNSTVYRYFKFLPQEMRSATPDAMQYSEFELTDGTSYYSPDSASQLYRADDTDGDDYVASQRVAASIDGSTSTKLYNGSWATKYYLYDMGSSFNTVLTGWRYKTANDNNSRDPVSWTLLGSTNNTDWVILDQRTQETITTTRQTATQDFLFNSSNQIIQNHANSNYPIAVNGDAHAGTFSPYRSGGYSAHLDDGEEISFPDSSNYNISNGSFSVEAWVYPTSYDSPWSGVVSQFSSASRGWGLAFSSTQITFLGSTNGGSSTNVNGSVTSSVPLNQWTHLLVTRDSNTIRIFKNGVLINSFTESGTFNNSTEPLRIGELNPSAGENFRGYIRDARVVKGSIPTEYQTSSTTNGTTIFTAPSEPLTAVTNTVLLTCHLPYISDGSTNNATPTLLGNVTTKPFSPYDYTEYSATDHGGSINYDGTGDYLTIPDHSSLNFASNDWTIECWIYPRTSTGDRGIWHQSASGIDWFSIYLDGSFNPKFVLKNYNSTEWSGAAASNTAPQNTWTHLALVRQFGTGIYLYANGTLIASDTTNASVAMEDKTHDHIIGHERFVGNGQDFDGLISDFKIDIGTAHYTADFTPPTAPLSSSGAELHIKGTDASIIDKSQRYNIDLGSTSIVGDSTTKWSGAKSIFINSNSNNSDLITIPAGVLDASKPFTIEMWLKTLSGAVSGFWSIYQDASNEMRLKMRGDDRLEFYHRGSGAAAQEILDTTNTYLLNNTDFYHVAITRDANAVFYLHQNGIKLGNFTANGNYNSLNTPFIIGKSQPATERFMQGYIQDFRITQGLARYTAADESSNIPTASLEG